MIICTMPECQTSAGCMCQRRGIIVGFGSTEAIYDSWLQAKDAEIVRLRSDLANARNAALEEAAKAADTIGAGFAQYRDHWPMRDGAYEAAREIRALKAEGESNG